MDKCIYCNCEKPWLTESFGDDKEFIIKKYGKIYYLQHTDCSYNYHVDDEAPINFCPMCGRPLKDKEDELDDVLER